MEAEAMRRLGILISGRNSDESLRLLTGAVRLRPNDAGVRNDLGVTLERCGRAADAAECYRAAARLQPDYYQVWTNLANALLHSGELGGAEEAVRRSIQIRCTYAPAHNALGCILVALGRIGNAVESLRKAIRLKRDYAQAHANLGMALLTLGDFPAGWGEHEWRRNAEPSLNPPLRPWSGGDLFGHTILLIAEGGLGNVIQFARFAGVLAPMGVRVALECQPPLVPLLSMMGAFWRVVGTDDPDRSHKLAACDTYCPLMSVPAVLGTTPPTIPAQVPYLQAEPARVKRWGEALAEMTRGRGDAGTRRINIGVCWSGEQKLVHRRNRSIPLYEFAPLARVPGVRLVSLQKGCTALPGPPFPLTELPGLDESGGAFMDTAAVMQHLDLVITCDTSIAHLAGALGVPVWVALPAVADWRWMLGRDDSPWYPTMRLFRQHKPGEWGPVFARMAEELETRGRGSPDPVRSRAVAESARFSTGEREEARGGIAAGAAP